MGGWPDFTQQSQLYQGLDLLQQDSTSFLAPTLNLAFTTVKSYSGILVFMQPGTAATITCTVQDQAQSLPSWRQRKTTTSNVRPLFFASPFPISAGAIVTVILTSSVNQVSGSGIWVYGVGSPQPATQGSVLLRSDGYSWPRGDNGATAGVAASNGPIVLAAAPPIAQAIHVLSVQVTNQTAATVLTCQGVVNGVTVNLIEQRGVGSSGPFVPPGGLKMDGSTSLQVVGAGAPTGDVIAFYDIIPVVT